MKPGADPRLKALGDLFRNYAGPAFAVQLWDGWSWYSSQTEDLECTIRFSNPAGLRMFLAHPNQLSLGEAFVRGDIDVDGDIFAAFSVGEHLFTRASDASEPLLQRLGVALLNLDRLIRNGVRHSRRRDSHAISYHYDQPVAFYKPWLGPTLAYSCAYFQSAEDSLEAAQMNKIDLICRKLRLRSSDRFLDIGCGWGSLVLHAANEYAVHAHGITLSKEQARVAMERLSESRLSQRCQIELRDYRTLRDITQPFDAIASIGMFEHVGIKNMSEYFAIALSCLKPGGVFLNHGIAFTAPSEQNSFMHKFVFPDAELVTVSHALSVAESAGFEVRDVENLRKHYALTLRRWVYGLQQQAVTLRNLVPETTYRIWLLGMAGAGRAFETGEMGVFQALLSRPHNGKCHLPLTRSDWYDLSPSGEAESRSSSMAAAPEL
jgi:cyclopropane-fatty-acyl-phospholipid synthase